MEIEKISNVGLGENVYVYYYDRYGYLRAPSVNYTKQLCKIIASNEADNYYYIGWADNHYMQGQPIDVLTNKLIGYQIIDFDKKINICKCVSGDTLIELVEKKPIYKDRKCIDCNLPAPHKKPNVGDNFQCSCCAAFLLLDQ